jgi:hypothetical protein
MRLKLTQRKNVNKKRAKIIYIALSLYRMSKRHSLQNGFKKALAIKKELYAVSIEHRLK